MTKDERKINTEEMDQDDPCVCCGEPSGEKKGTNIDQRLHYAESAGQLCQRCYKAVYD